MNEKLKIFEEELGWIKSKSIKAFTEFALLSVPEYFWTLPASTTRKHHGDGETLIAHVKACCYIAKHAVCDAQFKDHWTHRQKDQLISALILHDTYRCGAEGSEYRITQEMIDEKGYDQDLLGGLKTTYLHPEIGYQELLKLVKQYNDMNKGYFSYLMLKRKDYSVILKAVRYHYGPFLKIKYRPFSFKWKFNSVVIQCHNVDFLSTHSAIYYTRRKK